MLDAKPRDMDVCALVPHAAVRVYVMGERALALEPANQGDIAAMRALVAEAVRAGAFGFSTTRTISHKTLKGDFTPTLRAQEDELTGIAMGMRDVGAGFMELVSDWNEPDPATEFALMRRVVERQRPALAVLADRAARPDGGVAGAAGAVQRGGGGGLAHPAGVPAAADRHPARACRAARTRSAARRASRPSRNCRSRSKVAAMRDPAMRARMLSEDRVTGSNFPLMTRLSFERMFPFGDPPDYTPPRENSIRRAAAREGRTPRGGRL